MTGWTVAVIIVALRACRSESTKPASKNLKQMEINPTEPLEPDEVKKKVNVYFYAEVRAE